MKSNSILGLGVALCIPALVIAASVSAQAQNGPREGGKEGNREGGREGRPPGGPGGSFGGPGRFGGPGGAFRRSEKMQLGRFVRQVGDMEKAKKTPLNKKQAQKIIAVIAPWRKKASMNDADAQKLYVALRDTLTAAQKKAMDQRPPFGGPMGGPPDGRGPRGDRPDGPPPEGRGPRGDRPDGPPPGGRDGGREGRPPGGPRGGDFKPPSEAEMKKMQAGMKKMGEFVKTYNPFYPVASYKQVKDLPKPMQEGMERRYKEMQAVLSQLAAKK